MEEKMCLVNARIVQRQEIHEIGMSMVEVTGSQTKLGDGVQHNQDIYLNKKDGSLFVISIDGPVERGGKLYQ
ncbi:MULTISPECIES: hypothetical protein [unclassified Psychrobacillus]|uniref:hypothetical protein n=2 Tax=Psychrobacillus TaxID=1221880 RepID=UPI0011A7494D|nr:hypothetical protein [Psychrobacillus sp. AK 1817]QGM31192.1 hypothetical protein GI482_12700 [Bacillus sp. N3536]